MADKTDKYSLWIVPTGDTGEIVQNEVTRLANEFHAPTFVPHITLVADIFASSHDLVEEKAKIRELSNRIPQFSITLSGYGYLDEAYRSLYVLAHSDRLDAVYVLASRSYPQIANEHFRQMPHLSVLYGSYSPATKEEIIRSNPLPDRTFPVTSLDLYKTNNPVESWQLIESFPLRQVNK